MSRAEEDEIPFPFRQPSVWRHQKDLLPLNLLERNPTVNKLAVLLQRENVLTLARFVAEGLKRRKDIAASELPSENRKSGWMARWHELRVTVVGILITQRQRERETECFCGGRGGGWMCDTDWNIQTLLHPVMAEESELLSERLGARGGKKCGCGVSTCARTRKYPSPLCVCVGGGGGGELIISAQIVFFYSGLICVSRQVHKPALNCSAQPHFYGLSSATINHQSVLNQSSLASALDIEHSQFRHIAER